MNEATAVSRRATATAPPAPVQVFIGSEVFRGAAFADGHPLAIPRVPTLTDLVRALGWFAPGQYIAAPRAKPAALTRFHTPAYLAALQAAERTQTVSAEVRARHHIGTHANPVHPRVWRRPATAAGGAMLGAELIRAGGVAHVPGAGTHHGLPDRANGFCYLNDAVLAIMVLRAAGLRVAYVDLDAHHCDGVAHAFHGAHDVLMVSVHEERRWPFTGALEDDAGGAALNLPVPRGLNDSEMAEIAARLILPAVAGFAPDALVVQCGADALAEDPLSRLALSNRALWGVLAGLMPLAPRVLVLGGGGYNPWSVARAWAGVWALLAGHPLPDRLPAEARAVLAGLSWPRLRGPCPAHWTDRLADDPRPGPVRPGIRDRLAVLSRRIPRR